MRLVAGIVLIAASSALLAPVHAQQPDARAADRLYAQIEPDLQRFLGKTEGDAAHPLLSDWLSSALDVPHIKQLPSGATLVHGCRAHECGTKAAVLLTADLKIKAVGLLAKPCYPNQASSTGMYCGSRQLIIASPKAALSPTLVSAFKTWAAEQVAGDKMRADLDRYLFIEVDAPPVS